MISAAIRSFKPTNPSRRSSTNWGPRRRGGINNGGGGELYIIMEAIRTIYYLIASLSHLVYILHTVDFALLAAGCISFFSGLSAFSTIGLFGYLSLNRIENIVQANLSKTF